MRSSLVSHYLSSIIVDFYIPLSVSPKPPCHGLKIQERCSPECIAAISQASSSEGVVSQSADACEGVVPVSDSAASVEVEAEGEGVEGVEGVVAPAKAITKSEGGVDAAAGKPNAFVKRTHVLQCLLNLSYFISVSTERLSQLKSEGRYRQFFDIARTAGSFPAAVQHDNGTQHDVFLFSSLRLPLAR